MSSWSLESVKAGDEMIISGHFRSHDRLEKVDRVTKTQVVIGGNKYRISDGLAIGYGGEWNVPRASIPTNEQREAVRIRNTRKLLINALQSDDIAHQHVDAMMSAYKLSKDQTK